MSRNYVSLGAIFRARGHLSEAPAGIIQCYRASYARCEVHTCISMYMWKDAANKLASTIRIFRRSVAVYQQIRRESGNPCFGGRAAPARSPFQDEALIKTGMMARAGVIITLD